jgi:hypothetical protein
MGSSSSKPVVAPHEEHVKAMPTVSNSGFSGGNSGRSSGGCPVKHGASSSSGGASSSTSSACPVRQGKTTTPSSNSSKPIVRFSSLPRHLNRTAAVLAPMVMIIQS